LTAITLPYGASDEHPQDNDRRHCADARRWRDTGETFSYVCTDHGKSYPLKVDDKQNTLAWKGSIYKIKLTDCAKYGWYAEKDGASFKFCTATKGYGGIEQNDGTTIQCDMRR
jgi:hypothetical protein